MSELWLKWLETISSNPIPQKKKKKKEKRDVRNISGEATIRPCWGMCRRGGDGALHILCLSMLLLGFCPCLSVS
jgi:hypothetical protein